ncbi:hypothetical protein K1719_009730 [Acacia pycnantha]|nr:hypothetical protein K1719_009730 [Acacia pycnantha]
MATTCSKKRKRIGDGVSLLNSNKRKETLFRKCHELTVKSDAEVSLVCIGPDGKIEAWPNHEKVKAMLIKHREKQDGKKNNNGEFSLESELEEEKKKSVNDSPGKLSAESMMTLLTEIDSKLETLDEKIKTLSIQKTTDFCDCPNNSGDFMEIHDWHDLSRNKIESYGQPLGCSVQLNQPMVVSADENHSFVSNMGNQTGWDSQNTDIWEPEIELLGSQEWTGNGRDDVGALQNYYLGSDYWNWNQLLR